METPKRDEKITDEKRTRRFTSVVNKIWKKLY